MSFSRGRSTRTDTFHGDRRTDPAYATRRVRRGRGPGGTALSALRDRLTSYPSHARTTSLKHRLTGRAPTPRTLGPRRPAPASPAALLPLARSQHVAPAPLHRLSSYRSHARSTSLKHRFTG